jgi:hypothetical protein
MAFQDLKENTEEIQEQAKAYFESSLNYYKLHGFKVAMKTTTMVLRLTLIVVCFSMVLLFCSIAAAFAIGNYLNSLTYGFLIVAGVYLVLTGLLYLLKNKIIEGPIIEKFSEIFFND